MGTQNHFYTSPSEHKKSIIVKRNRTGMPEANPTNTIAVLHTKDNIYHGMKLTFLNTKLATTIDTELQQARRKPMPFGLILHHKKHNTSLNIPF